MRGRPMQRRHVGRHRSACATNSDCAQTSMSFAQKGHSTMVETRAPHDCDLRTGPKPWPVTECTGSVEARLPLQSDAIGGSGPFPHKGSDAGCNFGTLSFTQLALRCHKRTFPSRHCRSISHPRRNLHTHDDAVITCSQPTAHRDAIIILSISGEFDAS
jgi:hypothetical protein